LKMDHQSAGVIFGMGFVLSARFQYHLVCFYWKTWLLHIYQSSIGRDSFWYPACYVGPYGCRDVEFWMFVGHFSAGVSRGIVPGVVRRPYCRYCSFTLQRKRSLPVCLFCPEEVSWLFSNGPIECWRQFFEWFSGPPLKNSCFGLYCSMCSLKC